VPNNFWGNQMPFHGDAYVGFVIDANIPQPVGMSEYLQCQLISELKRCVKYRITINISLAENSANAFSKIGIVLSDDTLKGNGTNLVTYPDAIYSNNSFVTDSIGWTKLEFEYIGTGHEKFLTIGYFNNNMNSDTMYIHEHVVWWPLAYAGYYLDSVSVYEVAVIENCEVETQNVFSPNGDGINDYFEIPVYDFLNEEKIQIFSRWGNLVYELNENNPYWEGKNALGDALSEGTYFYIFTATNKEKEVISKKGVIELVR